MCIRDRHPADGGHARVIPAVDEVFLHETQQLALAHHGIGAVSYTHLRAHETVLDLVCRLLLEKKK